MATVLLDMCEDDDEDRALVQQNALRRRARRDIKTKVDFIAEHMNELTNVRSKQFEQVVIDLRHVDDDITHVRELSLATHGLRDLSKVLKAQASSLSKYSSKVDFETLASCLRDKFEGSQPTQLNWERFGTIAASLFDRPAPHTTMRGPLLLQPKVRQQTQRRKKSTEVVAEVRAEAVDAQDAEADEATNERVTTLMHVLDDIQQRQPPTSSGFDLLSLLVHPDNPVQTVENFFDFSFIVKEKRAALKLDSLSGMPVAVAVNPEALEDKSKSQMVLSISMKALRELAKDLNSLDGSRRLNEGLAREDDLYDTADPHQQAELLQRRVESKKRKGPALSQPQGSRPGANGTQGNDEDEEEDGEDDDDEGIERVQGSSSVSQKAKTPLPRVKRSRR